MYIYICVYTLKSSVLLVVSIILVYLAYYCSFSCFERDIYIHIYIYTYICICIYDTYTKNIDKIYTMGWLWLVGSIKL